MIRKMLQVAFMAALTVWALACSVPAWGERPRSPEEVVRGRTTYGETPYGVTTSEISGPWSVRFDPNWGGPAAVTFPQLVSWTQRPEEGIQFYSGTATYQKSFDLPESLQVPGRQWVLDLGDVRNLAEVRLNGRNLGVLWAPPFRVDVTDALKPRGNRLEIDVVNFWPNRIIGDQFPPPEKRLTRTNIRKLTKDTPLLESGLLGPVTLRRE